MSFDDAARQAAEALGTQVGRVLQEQLQQFVTVVVDAAARERTALTEQAQQAVIAAEQTLQDALARAREEAAQDTEVRLEAAFAERSAKAAAEAASAADTARAAHETERAQWADRAARLEADLTERQQRDADLAARAERAEADRARLAGASVNAAALARLVSGFRALDEGRSLSQLLDTLATQVARNAARSAVFVVRGQARQGALLQGWAFSGFNGAPLDARSLSVPLEKLPALTDVVIQGGRSEVRTAGFAAADVNPLAFMSVPRALTGVAVPVLVGGQVAAVVYGDDGGIAPGAAQEASADEVVFEPGEAFASNEPIGAGALDAAVGASANASTNDTAPNATIAHNGDDERDAPRAVAAESPAEPAGSPDSAPASTVDARLTVPSASPGAVKPADAAADGAALALSNWADALELLARHAARCLEAQTAIRAARLSSSAQPAPLVQASFSAANAGAAKISASVTGLGDAGHAASEAGGAEAATGEAAAATAREAAAAADAYAEEHARRYARLLIADIRLYNEAAVRAGREHRDLWHRLQPDIARARRAFEDRVTDVADRERLFDEELVRTLADGDEALLGFDLMRPSSSSSSSSSAERLAV